VEANSSTGTVGQIEDFIINLLPFVLAGTERLSHGSGENPVKKFGMWLGGPGRAAARESS
jgi:hypothetical protein